MGDNDLITLICLYDGVFANKGDKVVYNGKRKMINARREITFDVLMDDMYEIIMCTRDLTILSLRYSYTLNHASMTFDLESDRDVQEMFIGLRNDCVTIYMFITKTPRQLERVYCTNIPSIHTSTMVDNRVDPLRLFPSQEHAVTSRTNASPPWRLFPSQERPITSRTNASPPKRVDTVMSLPSQERELTSRANVSPPLSPLLPSHGFSDSCSPNPACRVNISECSTPRYELSTAWPFEIEDPDIEEDSFNSVLRRCKMDKCESSHDGDGDLFGKSPSWSSPNSESEFAERVEKVVDSKSDCSDDFWTNIYNNGYCSPVFDDADVEYTFENRTRGRMMLKAGNVYGSRDLFYTALRECAMLANFQLKPIRTSPTTITAKCADERCSWRIHAKKLRGVPTFIVKSISSKHTCGFSIRSRDHRQATSKWVACRVSDMLKEHPDFTPKQIVTFIHKQFGVTITYRKAWIAKEHVTTQLVGGWEESFRMLPSYCMELQRVDPDVVMLLVRGAEDQFKRFFWAFGPCIRSYSKTLRPIVSVDASHTKGKYRGQLLVATCLDGNNGVFPLAFAVVEAENTDTWSWFFQILGERIVGLNSQFVLISDRHHSILESMSRTFPNVSHGFCLRHICDSFQRKFKDAAVRQRIWAMGELYTKPAFNRAMGDFQLEFPRYHKWLSSIDPKKWTRAYFPTKRYRMMTTNISECINNVLMLDRELPITSLVQATHQRIAGYYFERSQAGKSFTDKLTPFAIDQLKQIDAKSNYVAVRQAGLNVFEVNIHTRKYVVDLDAKTCTCRRYDQLGIPCVHALAAITEACVSKYDYCEDWFATDRYRATYSEIIHLTVDHTQWSDLHEDVHVNPPNVLVQPSRPRKSRVKSHIEKLSFYKCGNCGHRGHNRRRCNYPPA